MSQITGVLEKLEGTSVYDTLIQMEAAYERAKPFTWRHGS